MFVAQSQKGGCSPARQKEKTQPCKFCQRSRWLMTSTILVTLLAVMFLNHG